MNLKLKKVVTNVKERFDLLAKINGKKNKKREKGFTLIELIAVVIIIGVLLALIVPRILGSSNDANAKLIAKTVQDIRDATAMAKMKCASTINNDAGSQGTDTNKLIPDLWGSQCQILTPNSFNLDTQNNVIKIGSAGYTVATDYQSANSNITFTINCQDNDVCTKAQTQINNTYNNACSLNGTTLTCTLPV